MLGTLETSLRRAVTRNRGRGGGVFAVWDGDRCLWEGAAGPLRPDDTFEIASITKMFTATLVLQLVDAGKLQLGTRLGDVLPASLAPDVTIKQLLSHTSGLADYWSDPPYVAPDTNAFVRDFLADPQRLWSAPEILAYVPALRPPRSRWHYSDTNYVLLALVVEALTARPLHLALREQLLTPLGLGDTYLSYREPAPFPEREAHRFEEDLDLHGRPHQSADWGGGGLVSSTRDLVRFVRALAGGRLLQPATLAAMLTFAPTGEKDVGYGLGVYGLTLDDGLGHLWGHDGHGNSFLYHWPERGVTFAGTLNQTGADWWPLVETAIEALS